MSATSEHQHEHDHAWTTASEHTTSEGRIIYQSCTCGGWRVLRQHDFTTVLATR